MEKMSVNGILVFFEPEEHTAVEVIGEACNRTTELVHSLIGLGAPKGCRVYVMTSWLRFVFHASPWYWVLLNSITFPILYLRASRIWRYSNGWSLPYKSRPAVGIKPPRLHQCGDMKNRGEYFLPVEGVNESVQHTTCHELVHAFTTHLKLPGWLNEGLALRMTDYYFGKPIIKMNSLQILEKDSKVQDLGDYRSLSAQDMDNLLYIYLRGYWITRYLDETNTGFLKSLLSHPLTHSALECKIEKVLGIQPGVFWQEIDPLIVSHYQQYSGN